jgi:hypothetical protein
MPESASSTSRTQVVIAALALAAIALHLLLRHAFDLDGLARADGRAEACQSARGPGAGPRTCW